MFPKFLFASVVYNSKQYNTIIYHRNNSAKINIVEEIEILKEFECMNMFNDITPPPKKTLPDIIYQLTTK